MLIPEICHLVTKVTCITLADLLNRRSVTKRALRRALITAENASKQMPGACLQCTEENPNCAIRRGRERLAAN